MKENPMIGGKNKNVWICVFFVALFILVIILLYYHTKDVELNQNSQIKGRLREVAALNSEYLKNLMDEKKRIVTLTSKSLAEMEDLSAPLAVQKLAEVAAESGFNSMSIVSLDGSSVNESGHVSNAADEEYLTKISEGEIFITDSIQSRIDGTPVVCIVSPIVKDGVVSGAIEGELSTNSLMKCLEFPILSGKGQQVLTDGAGEVLSQTDGDTFSHLEDSSYFVESAPVGINDWLFTAMAAQSVAEDYTRKINYSAGLLVLEISIAMFLFFLFLIWILNRSNREFVCLNNKLRIDEKRYRFMLERTDNIIFDFDIEGGRIEYSEKFQKIFRVLPIKEGLPYSVIENERVHPQDGEALVRLFQEIKDGKESMYGEFRVRNGEGKYVWCSATVVTIFDDQKNPVKGFGLIENIHEKKELENKYREIQIYKNALDSDRVSIFEVNLTKDTYISGYAEMLEMSGLKVENVYSSIQKGLAENFIYKDDMEEFNEKTGLAQLLLEYGSGNHERQFDFRLKVGKEKFAWARYKFRSYCDPDSKDICCIISLMDVNTQKCRELELLKRAEQDQLTGLYNKTTTENLIKEYLLSCESSEGMSALLIVDVDNFKNINDVLGHMKGDMVLQEVAGKLKSIFSTNDIVGRLGGDEFFVFMKGCTSVLNVERKAQEIIKRFRITYSDSFSEISISASVGIAICPDDGITFEELYKRADQALYISKKSGKDTYT